MLLSQVSKPAADRSGNRFSAKLVAPALFAGVIAAVAAPTTAAAYMGPGAGLGAIGSLLALVGAVFLGLLGFVWYPVKKLLRAVRKTAKPDRG